MKADGTAESPPFETGTGLVTATGEAGIPLVASHDVHDRTYAHLCRDGSRRLMACQTIFGDPTRMKQPAPVKDGYGDGGFVVVRGETPGADSVVE